MTRVLIIPANTEDSVYATDIGDSLSEMSELVGGMLEMVRVPQHFDTAAMINEEGKLENLRPNIRATAVLQESIGPFDVIAGNCFVLNIAEDGENADISIDAESFCRGRCEGASNRRSVASND